MTHVMLTDGFSRRVIHRLANKGDIDWPKEEVTQYDHRGRARAYCHTFVTLDDRALASAAIWQATIEVQKSDTLGKE